jgi:two-component system, OmpR family, sensor kinase
VGLCRDEVERTSSLAPQLAVTCTGPQEGEAIAEVDPLGVREVVANLLDNARRHAREHTEVRVERRGGGWRIEVVDDGPGVEPQAHDLIFERFATLDGHGGSGLGLPIARSIAEAHGGSLRYLTGRFVLDLPAAPAPSGTDVDDDLTSPVSRRPRAS